MRAEHNTTIRQQEHQADQNKNRTNKPTQSRAQMKGLQERLTKDAAVAAVTEFMVNW